MINKKHPIFVSVLFSLLTLSSCQLEQGSQNTAVKKTPATTENTSQWLAGDHHVHSIYSAKWDHTTNPATPIIGGDANNSTLANVQMARKYGLSWVVTTDHGGPNHSQLNLNKAYPDLVAARQKVPQVMVFYGMEFDTPGARHSTLMIPKSDEEAQELFAIESQFNRREVEPDTTSRDSNEFMLEALQFMAEQTHPPILIVNHPARLATGLGEYGKVTPAKMRDWQDTASNVVIGMTGLPGHKAATLYPDGTIKKDGVPSEYFKYPTMGGYDQMTARLGGFWDSMLGEGRHWWITAASDSHAHYSTGRTDFWPGQYNKLYVYAQNSYQSVMDNLRAGRMFVTSGDLINELYVQTTNKLEGTQASIGETLTIKKGDSITLTVRFAEPQQGNANGQHPKVARVDVITGDIVGPNKNRDADTNLSTKVLERFTAADFVQQGKFSTIQLTIEHITQSQYVRIRGTNQGDELEPRVDEIGEDPWTDLWFYSNPIFIKVSP